MRRIGIITNEQKDKDLRFTRMLVESIAANGGHVKIQSDIADRLGIKDEKLDEEAVLSESDVMICLGGDGTFLKVSRKAHKKELPILGINLGSMGFLTEVEKKDIDEAVKHIINGTYEIETRIMLQAKVLRDGIILGEDTALNDIVISRGALSRILHVKTYINNVFVDSFPGDGLIVSSPTGSTAYSLSCGGPIVEPDLDLIIVTPICPHILYTRSFITSGSRTVKVIVDESYSHTAMVTVDGQEGYEIHGGDIIEIRKAESTVKLIRINPRDFFSILRKKIYYRGENLRGNEI